jgi:hypothetical protein
MAQEFEKAGGSMHGSWQALPRQAVCVDAPLRGIEWYFPGSVMLEQSRMI